MKTWGRRTIGAMLFLFAAVVLGGLCGCATKQTYVPDIESEEIEAAPTLPSIPPNKMPRVMLLIDEKSLGTIPTSEVEAMASGMLLKHQVPVVDQDMVRANVSKGQQTLKMAGDARGAAALGLQFGADVMLVGEAVAKPSPRRIAESNLRAYQAVVTLRAVRTDNSAMLASSSEDASIVGLDDVAGSSKALKAAGRKSLDELIPAMLTAWVKTGGAGAGQGASVHVVMTVGGMDQIWKLKAIRELLHGMTGKVENVAQRSYTSGVAVFELDSLIAAEELSETMVLRPPKGLRFQVLDVGAGKIDLKAVSAP